MNRDNFNEKDNMNVESEEQENLNKVESCSPFPEWNETIQKNVVGYH
jgi:hypothetical protein